MTPTPSKTPARKRSARKPTPSVPPTVVLTGAPGAGKDTVAESLGLPTLSFADALRAEVAAADPVIICERSGTHMLWSGMLRTYGLDAGKRAIPEVREILIRAGIARRVDDPDHWVTPVLSDPALPGGVITDCRYLNEWERVSEAVPARLVAVVREGGPTDPSEANPRNDVADLVGMADYTVTLTEGESNDDAIDGLRRFLGV